MTINEILEKTYQIKKISHLDAEILLSLVLKKPKEYILGHPEQFLNQSQRRRMMKLIARRISGEPIAYLTGVKEFYGRNFTVNKNVLIPRPETELLVDVAMQCIQNSKGAMPNCIIDVGTGSGNIAISIVKEMQARKKNISRINFFALDISIEALKVAKQNAKLHQLKNKIFFSPSNLLQFIKNNKNIKGSVLIVANLPYVSSLHYKKNIENLKFEPKIALTSIRNGTGLYRKLFDQIRFLRLDQVELIIEISPEQKREIFLCIRKYWPYAKIKFLRDISGRWRIAHVKIK